MRIGVCVPTYNEYSSPAMVVETAKRAEALGYGAVWCIDHVAIPGYDTGRVGDRHLEQLITLSHLAAHVQHVRIGTDVVVAPYRHPVLAAKMLATLDVLSGGRLIIGVGTGYIEGEFNSLDVPFETRGTYTDECVRVWKRAWKEGTATFEGECFNFSDMAVAPKPVQKPHPPIWFGNAGERVLRRVVELGDGWHPVGLTFAQLEAGMGELRDMAAAANRQPVPAVSYSGLQSKVTEAPLADTERLPLSGTWEQILADVHRLESLGVDNVVVRFGEFLGDPKELPREMTLFAQKVLREVRSSE